MNAASRPQSGPPCAPLTLQVARDVQSRATRIREAIEDGDLDFAKQVADDLTADMWRLVEAAEYRQ